MRKFILQILIQLLDCKAIGPETTILLKKGVKKLIKTNRIKLRIVQVKMFKHLYQSMSNKNRLLICLIKNWGLRLYNLSLLPNMQILLFTNKIRMLVLTLNPLLKEITPQLRK